MGSSKTKPHEMSDHGAEPIAEGAGTVLHSSPLMHQGHRHGKPRRTWAGYFRWAMGAYGVILVLAMFPYSNDPTGDVKYLLTSVAACGLTLGWLTVTWFTGQPLRRPRLFFEILIVFLAFNVIATMRSSHIGCSLVELRRYFELFLLYFVASQIYRTESQVRRLLGALCASVLAASVYGLFQKAGWDFFPWADKASIEYQGLPSTFGNPNFAAHMLILAVLASLYLARKGSRAWYWTLTGVFLIHLYFTGERASVLALGGAMGLCLVVYLIGRRVKMPTRAAVMSFGVVGVLGVLGVAGVLGLNHLRTGSAFPLDTSLLIRYNSYRSAARMILERPVLGYGPGVYRIEYPRFWTPFEQNWFARELKMNAHVHNDALEIAVDAGLPAAGVYLAFLVFGLGYGMLMAYTGRTAVRRRMGYFLIAFFAAFLIDGCFGFNLRVPVSAACLFIVAGMMEGLRLGHVKTHARERVMDAKAYRAAGGRLLAAALLAGCLIADTRLFMSQMALYRGWSELHNENFESAKQWLTRGERWAPWDWQFSRQLGLICVTQRDFPAAIKHLERSLERNPFYVVTMAALSRAHMGIAMTVLEGPGEPAAVLERAQPNLDAAAQFAENALTLCPEYARAEEMLGRVDSVYASQMERIEGLAAHGSRALGLWTKAAGHLSRAILFGADNLGELYRLLGRVMQGLKNEKAAEEAFLRAVQVDPADDESWSQFYEYARAAKRFDRLRDTLEYQCERMKARLKSDDAALSEVYLWLATVYHEGYGEQERAEGIYRQAVQLNPLRSGTWRVYARFALQTSRVDAFMDEASATCKLFRDNHKAPLAQIEALAVFREKGEDALPDATRCLVTGMEERQRLGRTAGIAYEMGWAGDMLLDAAKKAQPKVRGRALLDLAVFFAGIGEVGRAEQLYPAAMPELPPAYQSLCAQRWAQALSMLNRPLEAVQLLQMQIGHDPENLGLRLSLARTYARAKMWKAAESEYEKLQEEDLDEDSMAAVASELRLVRDAEVQSGQ